MNPALAPQLEQAISRWISGDPDVDARRELLALQSAHGGLAELEDRFAGELEFGTAGLRGVLGAGPNRMNLAVVMRATRAVAEILSAQVADAAARGVVVGYDGRRRSSEFAAATAEVLRAAGLNVYLFDSVVPTPLLAYAVLKLNCAGGVMITASHNPPEYNGYKLYWSNGAQIIAPIDTAIAAAIASGPPANTIALSKDGILPVPTNVEHDYLSTIAQVAQTPGRKDRTLKIVYTAMHGVGAKLVLEALGSAGYAHVHSVGEQEQPDGEFPTVRFPNPEEKGAMDLAFALAKETGAHIVLANDPDADRLAVALPNSDGKYVQLTGNQVGILLGNRALETYAAQGDLSGTIVLNSCVSSPMLGAIAKAKGAQFEETLTGFKWIANRAIARFERDKLDFLFGYEEALGYTVGTTVRDKDGVSAALYAADLAATLRAQGHTLWDELERLYREHGLFASSQISITRKGIQGAAELAGMMAKLRKEPPAVVAGCKVLAFSDFEAGTRSEGSTVHKLELPPSNVLVFELEGGHRIIARPSGTEPKAKLYFDVREPIADGETLQQAEVRAQAALRMFERAMQSIVGLV
jgi:phosphomannomutase